MVRKSRYFRPSDRGRISRHASLNGRARTCGATLCGEGVGDAHCPRCRTRVLIYGTVRGETPSVIRKFSSFFFLFLFFPRFAFRVFRFFRTLVPPRANVFAAGARRRETKKKKNTYDDDDQNVFVTGSRVRPCAPDRPICAAATKTRRAQHDDRDLKP